MSQFWLVLVIVFGLIGYFQIPEAPGPHPRTGFFSCVSFAVLVSRKFPFALTRPRPRFVLTLL